MHANWQRLLEKRPSYRIDEKDQLLVMRQTAVLSVTGDTKSQCTRLVATRVE
ncbi:hypothetical protein Poly24_17480 [Rosistilla carotiformis]|uniref:Uncharacterized protein n=1 Tax=Rosistilla carotiformis TaxID=2528017 RepID=A0A518JR77_9BACT|nr:hypothetical protein Poly24_17480 [Rosistilla carotiformis]